MRTPDADRPAHMGVMTTPAHPEVIYFSSVSDNTHRFVTKLDVSAARIPLHRTEEPALVASAPYVLITPTYGQAGAGGHIPPQVHRFLGHPDNRRHLTGIVGCGNTNFGSSYAVAADLIQAKLQDDQNRDIPILGRVELMGLPEDVIEITCSIRDVLAAVTVR